MSLSIDVLNTKGEKVSTVDLPEAVFGMKPATSVVHEVVNAYLANRRRGTHSTKTRGEVSGGGLKPWKQKHTGRARAGSTRSPLWRHGGIIFGPKPRSYRQGISSTKRHMALKAVLSDFLKSGKLKVVDAFSVTEPKTKKVAELVKRLNVPARTILVTDSADATLLRAARNYEGLRICRPENLNSYDALLSEQLLFTQSALEAISKRLAGEEKAAANA